MKKLVMLGIMPSLIACSSNNSKINSSLQHFPVEDRTINYKQSQILSSNDNFYKKNQSDIKLEKIYSEEGGDKKNSNEKMYLSLNIGKSTVSDEEERLNGNSFGIEFGNKTKINEYFYIGSSAGIYTYNFENIKATTLDGSLNFIIKPRNDNFLYLGIGLSDILPNSGKVKTHIYLPYSNIRSEMEFSNSQSEIGLLAKFGGNIKLNENIFLGFEVKYSPIKIKLDTLNGQLLTEDAQIEEKIKLLTTSFKMGFEF